MEPNSMTLKADNRWYSVIAVKGNQNSVDYSLCFVPSF